MGSWHGHEVPWAVVPINLAPWAFGPATLYESCGMAILARAGDPRVKWARTMKRAKARTAGPNQQGVVAQRWASIFLLVVLACEQRARCVLPQPDCASMDAIRKKYPRYDGTSSKSKGRQKQIQDSTTGRHGTCIERIVRPIARHRQLPHTAVAPHPKVSPLCPGPD